MKSLTINVSPPVRRDVPRRRGMSLLVVVLLVSVATVVSYAVLRGQATTLHIQENADLRAAARHAAASGLTYGLRAMHYDDWQGVDSTETRTLATHERFTVWFTPGDPSLQSGDTDYGEYAYRVTLRSTGYVEDPKDTNRVASYTIRAVVRLIPRALSTWTDWPANHANSPTDWYKMEGYTVYQTKQEDIKLDIPCRLQGKVRAQKKLIVGEHYPAYPAPWYYYLDGLRRMLSSGYPDYRPLTGTLYLPTTSQDHPYFSYLCSRLDLSAVYRSADETASDWAAPTGLDTYQIYPGGPVYEITDLDGIPENTSLEPDAITNPLGLYHQADDCTLQGAVSVRGTLLCDKKVTILGTAQFQSVDMPALYGSTAPVRLPVLSTGDDLFVEPGSVTAIQGLVAVFDEFHIKKSPATLPFSLTGRLVTKRLYIKERQPWEALSTTDWNSLYIQWIPRAATTPFPVWLAERGYDFVPRITIMPDDPVDRYRYVWNNWNNPVYVPHDDDDGLHWEMLKWNEGTN